MKCEVCGKPTEPKMCDWLTNVMCPEHAKQVKDYIEGLKPKEPTVRVSTYSDGYEVREWGGLPYYMPRLHAGALYEHMRRERENK